MVYTICMVCCRIIMKLYVTYNEMLVSLKWEEHGISMNKNR